MTNAIRIIALAIIRRPGTQEFLVFQGHDPSRNLKYHRPFGGGMEFGETAEAAVRRELLEEIGADVIPQRLLPAAQSFFAIKDRHIHEIALPVECRFADRSLYERDRFQDLEGNGEDGLWRTIDAAIALFPEELPPILRSSGIFR
jgi:8-oxo-dGTP pyrophosphatase MutT (NUDIX family)